jgi:hypothetical protein
MAKTTPTRVDEDLFASAQLVAPLMERSAAQQLAYWARVGREIEAAADVSHRDIADVLAHRRAYDDLSAKEQAIVRAEWAERMAARRKALNLATRFRREGRAYVELDAEGRVVHRELAKPRKR